MEKAKVPARAAKGHSKSQRRFNLIVHIVLSLAAILFVLPFIWMIVISFDGSAAINIPFPPTLYPKQPTLLNYAQAVDRLKVWKLYLNTFAVVIGVVLISVVTSTLTGYALEKIRFKGSKAVLLLCLATMMIPFEATMIPLFMMFKSFGMINSYLAFFLPAFSYPFGVFLTKQQMQSIPDSLREAAIIDGASELNIFVRIFMPLSTTTIATLVILQFLNQWNNLLWPLVILNNPEKYTIQIGLALFKNLLSVGDQGASASYPGITMAGTVLSILPVLVVYLYLQKYIVQSVATAGMKQ